MRDSYAAISNTLSRICLDDVRGGIRDAPSGGGSSVGQQAAEAPTLTIPKDTLGVRPQDCGPAGPAWTIELHGKRPSTIPFQGDVPYTVVATQCK